MLIQNKLQTFYVLFLTGEMTAQPYSLKELRNYNLRIIRVWSLFFQHGLI